MISYRDRSAVGATPGRRVLRLVAPVAVIAAALGAVVGVRDLTSSSKPALHRTTSTVIPKSNQVEANWGVRFVHVRLLAGTGLVDVQYQVLDQSKADKLHSNGTKNLPKIQVPGGPTVVSASAMFHFHASETTDATGRAFNFWYGNTSGAIVAGTEVTLVLADGTRLEHVPVLN